MSDPFDQDELDDGPDATDADLLDEDRIELLTCPHCGLPVYEEAHRCTHCGQWITLRHHSSGLGGKPLWYILAAVAALAAMLYLVL